jgi:hypothetical protein
LEVFINGGTPLSLDRLFQGKSENNSWMMPGGTAMDWKFGLTLPLMFWAVQLGGVCLLENNFQRLEFG